MRILEDESSLTYEEGTGGFALHSRMSKVHLKERADTSTFASYGYVSVKKEYFETVPPPTSGSTDPASVRLEP